jgi:hypothetical protein
VKTRVEVGAKNPIGLQLGSGSRKKKFAAPCGSLLRLWRWLFLIICYSRIVSAKKSFLATEEDFSAFLDL